LTLEFFKAIENDHEAPYALLLSTATNMVSIAVVHRFLEQKIASSRVNLPLELAIFFITATLSLCTGVAPSMKTSFLKSPFYHQ